MEMHCAMSYMHMVTSLNENIYALLPICAGNSPGTGDTQTPVMRSLDAFFDLHPNKRQSKQWWDCVIWDAIVPIMTSP